MKGKKGNTIRKLQNYYNVLYVEIYIKFISLFIAPARRMRAQSQERGDGSPFGIHFPITHRRHWVTQERNYGSRFRRRYGKL